MKKMTTKKICFLYIVTFLLVLIIFGGALLGLKRVGDACNASLGITYYSIDAKTIPDSYDGFRIAHISDLHNAQFGENNKYLLELLAQTQPDMIAITGDLVDSDRTDIDVAIAFARGAVEIAPCYFIIGNNEVTIEEYARLESELKATGVVILHDEAIDITYHDAIIRLAGYDDPYYFIYRDKLVKDAAKKAAKASGASQEELERISKVLDKTEEEQEEESYRRLRNLEISQEEFTILLSHRPELFEDYCKVGADIVLTGHAHGGQIRFENIGGLYAPGQGLLPQYDSGIYQEGDTYMVVSRGLGNSSFPFRINNPPEIVVVDIE